MPDDQVGPQSVHDARGFGECPGRRDRKAQLGEDRLTALAAVGVFIDEQHQRCESLLVAGAAAAARTMAAVGALAFVRNAGRARK